VVGYWRGYQSGVRCRCAYGPVDTIAAHYLLLQEIQTGFGFTSLVPAHPGSLDKIQKAIKRSSVVVAIHKFPSICNNARKLLYKNYTNKVVNDKRQQHISHPYCQVKI